jgi:hypothetical protein
MSHPHTFFQRADILDAAGITEVIMFPSAVEK